MWRDIVRHRKAVSRTPVTECTRGVCVCVCVCNGALAQLRRCQFEAHRHSSSRRSGQPGAQRCGAAFGGSKGCAKLLDRQSRLLCWFRHLNRHGCVAVVFGINAMCDFLLGHWRLSPSGLQRYVHASRRALRALGFDNVVRRGEKAKPGLLSVTRRWWCPSILGSGPKVSRQLIHRLPIFVLATPTKVQTKKSFLGGGFTASETSCDRRRSDREEQLVRQLWPGRDACV
jgi:hypothetical protein